MLGDVSQKRFASGVTALTLSVVVVKVIGLVYKIPLFRLLGAEGMGYFGAAYELYALFFVISSAGLPVAVSMLISEQLAYGKKNAVSRIHTISLLLFLVLGAVGTLAMSLGASGFSKLLDNEKAAPAILAVSPALLFVCISGAMRGYYQGLGDMRPTAISQVIEAVGKLGFGLGFALAARKLSLGAERAAAFAAFGITVGTFLSMLYLLSVRPSSYSKRRTGALPEIGRRTVLRRLIALAVPVTLSASLSGFTRVLDMGLIMRHLQSDIMDSSAVAALYGCYSTMAVPIYNLPASFVSGISLSLVPMLTAAVGIGERERTEALCGSAIRFCLFLSFPSAVGMALFAEPILALLFSGQVQSVALAAPLLSALAFSVVSSCLMGVTASILQAKGKAFLPIFSMLIAAVIKFVSAYVLMSIPDIGIYAIPISTLLCNTLAVLFNLAAIDRQDISLRLWRLSLAPMASSVLAIGGGVFLFRWLSCEIAETLAFVIVLPICVLLYLLLGGKLGAYGADEVRIFPSGERLCALLTRLHIIKKEGSKKEEIEYERRYHQRAGRENRV